MNSKACDTIRRKWTHKTYKPRRDSAFVVSWKDATLPHRVLMAQRQGEEDWSEEAEIKLKIDEEKECSDCCDSDRRMLLKRMV